VTPYDRPVFVREITVVTAPKPPPVKKTAGTALLGFLATNWDKLLGALASTGLLGWFVAWMAKRRSTRKKPPNWETPS